MKASCKNLLFIELGLPEYIFNEYFLNFFHSPRISVLTAGRKRVSKRGGLSVEIAKTEVLLQRMRHDKDPSLLKARKPRTNIFLFS